MKKTLIQKRSEGTKLAILDTAREIAAAQLPLVASSLAYTTILSIIPLLAVSFAVFKAFGGLEKFYDVITPFLLSNLAENAGNEAMDKISLFIENTRTATVGIGGFLGLLITSMSMLYSIENSFNTVWNAKQNRKLVHRLTTYWMIITLGPLAAAVALGAATSSSLPLASWLPNGITVFLFVVLAFFGIYKLVPHTTVLPKYALIAAVFSATLFKLGQAIFGVFVKHFANYGKVYGSLAAVPVLLMWIYIAWLIILGGAALNASLQRRFEKDPIDPETTPDDAPKVTPRVTNDGKRGARA